MSSFLFVWSRLTDVFSMPYFIVKIYLNGELLTHVNIPQGTVSIGNYAFLNCRDIAAITIPESVLSIGKYAFRGCRDLTELTVPKDVFYMGRGIVYNCPNLTSLTLPTMNDIGDDSYTPGRLTYFAEQEHQSLKKVTLTNCESLASQAFKDWTSLTSVTLPKGLKTVGEHAFYGCTGSFFSITLPKRRG